LQESHIVHKSIMILFCCVLLSGIPVSPAVAWNASMHPVIAQYAFDMLPASMKASLQEYLETILSASRETDSARSSGNNGLNVPETIAARQGQRLEKVVALTQYLESLLSDDPRDWESIAYTMGLLSQNLSDLNDPLDGIDLTDSEAAKIRDQYESDVWEHHEEIPVQTRGATFRIDASVSAAQDAGRAAYYYRAVLDAYEQGAGFQDARGITAINVQRAVQAVSDVWQTAWAKTVPSGPSVVLHMNCSLLQPGDTLRLSLSALPGKQADTPADVYLMFYRHDGDIWFLGGDGSLGLLPVPLVTSWQVGSIGETDLMSMLLPKDAPTGDYGWCIVLVSAGADLMDAGNWLGDPAVLSFSIAPFSQIRLADLGNEGYLLAAWRPDREGISMLPLRRWDFLFLGNQKDDPKTPEDESATDGLIPGVFNHMLVYMGRDRWGTAYGVEMTTNLSFEGPFLRIVKLPEFERSASGSENVRLTVVTKDMDRYGARWALRLSAEKRATLESVGQSILEQIETDIQNGLPYQLEYKWSGDMKDKQIFLVDDGREGGATCVDYWLSTLEIYAGICIHGSRITAAELEDYFLHDPEGSKAKVPDALNPFPFSITVKTLLLLGFHPVDPSPHVFSCDGSEETGLPIPDRLVERSPDLIAINAENIR
jgi:hypothetical protein